MSLTPHQAVDELRSAFEPLADPERAFAMSAYMRDNFEHLGIKAVPRRKASRDVELSMAKESPEAILMFCVACWGESEREFQHAAVDLLRRVAKQLEPDHLDTVRALITSKSWWDTVDPLAAHVVGPLVKRHEAQAVMDEWIEDDNLWVARSALLHQLFYKEDTDEIRVFDYCARQAVHEDFFIRKAIGWALRQYGRVDPDAVLAFVAEYDDQLSGLSKREALKHLG